MARRSSFVSISFATLGLFIALLCSSALPTLAEGNLTPQQIDHMIRAQWKDNDIVPAQQVDDAGYLRRIYLDITGSIPPAQAAEDFISDHAADKRARAVEALLDSPGYVNQWTNYWEGVLMSTARSQVIDRGAFRQWLRTQFERNTPWNRFVYDLITASGQNSLGGTYQQTMLAGSQSAPLNPGETSAINGATNWVLKYQGKPEDLSGTASKIFLGVQIQCAQCHDHKTEKWKQTDFRSFTANFINTRPKNIDVGMVKGGIRRVDLVDINRPFQPRGKKAASIADYAAASPAALDGTDFSGVANRRQSLANWMVADDNPWFANAIVNRMWGHFMGRAFVEPIDDFRPSNPAVMPELMNALSVDFKATGYDLKHLIKTICLTQAYQVGSNSSAKPGNDNVYWAKYRLKPMAPDQLLDSLVQATNVKPVLEQTVGANLDQIRLQLERQFQFLFDVDEEFEQKDFEGTIPQALLLLNGGLVNSSVRPIPGTALAEVQGMPGSDEEKITSLYLRTLSRNPTSTEIKRWVAYVNTPRETVNGGRMTPAARKSAEAPGKGGKKAQPNAGFNPLARAANQLQRAESTPKDQAYEDLFWALLNSSEFLFNH
jgi:hypothetical protein